MTAPELATAAADILRIRWRGFRPATFIGLGSGLGDVCREMKIVDEVGFEDVPGFAPPTVVGHPGKLRVGEWSGEPVLVMLGRMHLYEGHAVDRVVHPIRVAANLAVQRIVLSNMSGGVHADWPSPALAVVEGHRDLQSGWSEGFDGDVCRPYSKRLNRWLADAATQSGTPIRQAIYAGLLGPTYETPAEVRALRTLGCDLVGMSTVQEARVAAELGLECCAISCVANHAAGVTEREVDHADVVDAGKTIAPKLAALLGRFLRRVKQEAAE
jgi:purine-nucleoside phosphorylase